MKLVPGKLFKTMFSAKMEMFTRLVCCGDTCVFWLCCVVLDG
jgi:hypothetical protein